MLLSTAALATWYGRYYCGSCTFNDPFATGDTDGFIRAEVNKKVASWVDSKGLASSVTICNGTTCATYQYIKLSGIFQYKGYYFSNWNGVGEYTPPADGTSGDGASGGAYGNNGSQGGNSGTYNPPPRSGGGSGTVTVRPPQAF